MLVSSLLGLLFAVLVYRHASGKHPLPTWTVVVMIALCLVICLPAYLIGRYNNPGRVK